jgi:hypothetical protein
MYLDERKIYPIFTRNLWPEKKECGALYTFQKEPRHAGLLLWLLC